MDSILIYGFVAIILSSFFWGFLLNPPGMFIVTIVFVILWYLGFFRPLGRAKGHVGSGALGFLFFFLINLAGIIVSWIETLIIDHKIVYDFLIIIWDYLKVFTRFS